MPYKSKETPEQGINLNKIQGWETAPKMPVIVTNFLLSDGLPSTEQIISGDISVFIIKLVCQRRNQVQEYQVVMLFLCRHSYAKHKSQQISTF